MRVDGAFTLSVLLLVLFMASAAEGGILEALFAGDDSEQEPVEFPEGAGWFLDEEEFELGARGFKCLQDMAGVENRNNWGQNLMRPISRVMLKAYGREGIAKICGSQLLARMRIQKARSGHNRSRNLRKSANVTLPERRAQQQQQICSSFPANYAGSATEDSDVYDTFARNHIDDYLVTDRTQRTSAVKSFDLQDQVATTRLALTVFGRCSSIWSTVNQFIAIPDVPVIDQAAISEAIQVFVCDLPATYTQIAMMRLQRDQELVNFHNELVNAAEVGAMYQNTKTMMKELCDRESVMGRVLDDIDIIKRRLNRI